MKNWDNHFHRKVASSAKKLKQSRSKYQFQQEVSEVRSLCDNLWC